MRPLIIKSFSELPEAHKAYRIAVRAHERICVEEERGPERLIAWWRLEFHKRFIECRPMIHMDDSVKLLFETEAGCEAWKS